MLTEIVDVIPAQAGMTGEVSDREADRRIPNDGCYQAYAGISEALDW